MHNLGGNINWKNKDASNRTAFQAACFGGDFDVLEFLVSLDGIDINVVDKDLETGLHIACANNHFEIVQLLSTIPTLDITKVNKEMLKLLYFY